MKAAPMIGVYSIDVSLSLIITVWVARSLSTHGRPFLVQVFHRNANLADAVNQFLIVGFYLMNAGLIFLTMKDRTPLVTLQQAMNLLGTKIGSAITVLGLMHFVNLTVLCRIRDRTRIGCRSGFRARS